MCESVYIHIPFCKSKCKYCSFVSTISTELIPQYTDSLIKEIKNYYNSEELKTLYFGGGTPSLLDINTVEKIIENFKFSLDSEITFEINPDDAKLEYLKNLKKLGVNRLSFGSQTFDDNMLKLIGRRHDAKEILNAVKNAKNAGFENISVDLIYGLPEQTIDTLKNDLEIIKNLSINHVSTYGLKIEKPSHFYYNLPQNLPNDDTQADMYLEINDYLDSVGFKRYEISNFAHNGYESRHNLNYWNNKEYYGLGTAAHGHIKGIRYSNTNDINEYIKNPLKNRLEHRVTEKEKLEEEIFLGFRKESGINKYSINENYNINFDKKYLNIIEKYSPQYIIPTENGYKFTLDGVLLSNIILSEFID